MLAPSRDSAFAFPSPQCISVIDARKSGHKFNRSFLAPLQKVGTLGKHPIFEEDCCLGQVVPLTIHGDGAQFFREDENFVYSISSLLAPTGMISDILLYKFPFLIIPERHMRSEAVARQKTS